MLNGLDLFSGIGGLSLALEPWVRTVAYCERDAYAKGVLFSRMRTGELHLAPVWPDVQTLRGCDLPAPIDIIFGGFPCQDISVAGAGAGLAGERSGLVFELFRLVSECRPKFVFLENVPALAVRGLDRVLLELHALGYDARWTIVSAAEVGAPHLRERIWILAHANGHALRLKPESERRGRGEAEPRGNGEAESLADTDSKRLEKHRGGQAVNTRKNPGVAVIVGAENGGQLNPQWVEWLMGFPIAWTELSASETAWFRSQRGKRSKDSAESKGEHDET